MVLLDDMNIVNYDATWWIKLKLRLFKSKESSAPTAREDMTLWRPSSYETTWNVPRVSYDGNLEDFLEHLGVDHASAGSLIMAAAQHMFAAPLPPQWSEQVDEGSGRVYFFNRATGESLWQHPQKPLFEEILAEVRCWQPEASVESLVARAERHLRQAQQSALEVLSQWSAFDAPQAMDK
eukprot:s94_g10.t1